MEARLALVFRADAAEGLARSGAGYLDEDPLRLLETGVRTHGKIPFWGASHSFPQHHSKDANYQATYYRHRHRPVEHLGGCFSLVREKLTVSKSEEERAFLGEEVGGQRLRPLSTHPSAHITSRKECNNLMHLSSMSSV